MNVVVAGSVVECLLAVNKIGVDGAKAIADALKDNKTVTKIDFDSKRAALLIFF